MNRKQAEQYFKRLGGRAELAERVLEIAKEIVDSGSYKRALAGAGQMQVLAEVAQKSDSYWGEIKNRGYTKEQFYCSEPRSIKPLIGNDGHFSREHWEQERIAER